MKNIKYLFVAAVIALLSACGGSGSGGGAAQQFNGSAHLFLSAPGLAPRDLGEIGTGFLVSGKKITVSDSSGIVAKGDINGNNFSASGTFPGSDIGDGIICDETTIVFNGTINGATIIGNIGGGVNCTKNAVTVPFAYSGSFQASAVARAMLGNKIDYRPAVRAAFK